VSAPSSSNSDERANALHLHRLDDEADVAIVRVLTARAAA
jgi:hypothetical protein